MIRIEILTAEQFAAMLTRIGWTPEMVDAVTTAVDDVEALMPPACPFCGAYEHCEHEGHA